MFIHGSENILFNAIDAINDQNVVQEFTYVPSVQDLPVELQFGVPVGPITQQVVPLGNRLERSFNYIPMSHENVMATVANFGDFIHDEPVIYYNSQTHGIVRIYFHNTWVFHPY